MDEITFVCSNDDSSLWYSCSIVCKSLRIKGNPNKVISSLLKSYFRSCWKMHVGDFGDHEKTINYTNFMVNHLDFIG